MSRHILLSQNREDEMSVCVQKRDKEGGGKVSHIPTFCFILFSSSLLKEKASEQNISSTPKSGIPLSSQKNKPSD